MRGSYELDSLIVGDALECLSVLPDRYLDAIVTDPPYFLPAQHYSTRRQWPRSLSDLSILEHFFSRFFALAAEKLKVSGVFYIFCDGQSYPVFFATAYPHVRKVGPLVWDKMTSINGYSWRHQHELILFAEMDEAVDVKTGDGDILSYRAVPIMERIHPAQKPIALLARLIQKSVRPGGVICDPFIGSGSTAIAARQVGVHYLGFDRDAKYIQVAHERLDDRLVELETGQLPVLIPIS
jgi:site-specific DNA-methyltransferase (adenine-specific)